MTLQLVLAILVAVSILFPALAVKVPCNHRMYSQFDEASGRMFQACRCGERFER